MIVFEIQIREIRTLLKRASRNDWYAQNAIWSPTFWTFCHQLYDHMWFDHLSRQIYVNLWLLLIIIFYYNKYLLQALLFPQVTGLSGTTASRSVFFHRSSLLSPLWCPASGCPHEEIHQVSGILETTYVPKVIPCLWPECCRVTGQFS